MLGILARPPALSSTHHVLELVPAIQLVGCTTLRLEDCVTIMGPVDICEELPAQHLIHLCRGALVDEFPTGPHLRINGVHLVRHLTQGQTQRHLTQGQTQRHLTRGQTLEGSGARYKVWTRGAAVGAYCTQHLQHEPFSLKSTVPQCNPS